MAFGFASRPNRRMVSSKADLLPRVAAACEPDLR